MILVRYYAGARAAAGVPDEKLDADVVADVAGLVTLLGARHGARLRAVLAGCSFLVDGIAVTDRATPVPTGATVEVLPPFAGG